jgi:hypothetical protein
MAGAKINSPGLLRGMLLCGMLCWLFAGPAYAAVVDVTMSNLTFRAAAGNNSCSGQRCTETFNISFQYDTATGFAVGPINVTGTGALSAADIAGTWTVALTDDGLGHYFVYVAEFPPGPDYITIADTDLKYGASGAPASGVYPFSHAYLSCFESPTQCYDKFVFVSGGAHEPGAAICGTVSVTVFPVTGPIWPWPWQRYVRNAAALRSAALRHPCHGIVVTRAAKSPN